MIQIEHRYLYAGTIILVFFCGIYAWSIQQRESITPRGTESVQTVVVGNTPVVVEIADTEEKRRRGLSGRTALAEGTGMLFIMPSESYPSVWMPDMYIALDVLWINDELQIVHLEENMRPESYPATFTTPQLARYFLEVPAGFIQEYGITLGTTVQLP